MPHCEKNISPEQIFLEVTVSKEEGSKFVDIDPLDSMGQVKAAITIWGSKRINTCRGSIELLELNVAICIVKNNTTFANF